MPFHDIPGIETVEDLQKPGMEEKMGQTLVERLSRDEVADAACFVLAQPCGVNVDELVLTPLGQQW